MGFLDRFTKIDDLLVTLIERIGGVTEEDTHFFSYPNDGTRATIVKGKTTLDFMSGTAMIPDGTTSAIGNSLRARGREYCRSLSLQADKDIIVQIGTKSKIPVFAGTWFKVAHLRFTEVKITAAEDTRIFVIACTNPDSIEMAGETYIKDPADTWGHLNTIGMSELSVRVGAPPLTFDRRGDVMRWCDFESATPNYRVTASATEAVHGRSTDTASSGSFSYKAILGNAREVQVITETSDFHVGRVGMSMRFSVESIQPVMSLLISHYTGAKLSYAGIIYDTGSDAVQYINSDGNPTYIRAVSALDGIHAFSTMKLVVDLEKREYCRMLIHGTEVDMTGIALQYTASGVIKRLKGAARIGNGPNTRTAYIDDIVMTENEPI